MSTEVQESSPEMPGSAPEPSKGSSRAPLVFGVVIAAVLLFMGGWFIGYRAVTEMEATLASERATFTEELEAAREQAAQASLAQERSEARATMLAARQGLAQADDAIVSENFGLARQHLARTRGYLASGGEHFAMFAERAATLEILTAGDTTETRAQLRGLATELDVAISEAFGDPATKK